MTLTDFLLDRIAEDEARYEADPCEYGYGHSHRMAECEAKRQIVEFFAAQDSLQPDDPLSAGLLTAEGVVLPHLALPYASHPDYREEWRP